MNQSFLPFFTAKTHADVIRVLENGIDPGMFDILRDRKDSLYRIYIPKSVRTPFLPCLCAHSDTVHPEKPETLVLEHGRLFNPGGGSGADNRNGVYILHELMKYDPAGFIFCLFNHEESGQQGSKAADLSAILNRISVFIGLDREGNREIGLRGYDDEELVSQLRELGHFSLHPCCPTDAFRLSRRYGISAMNVSAGFYNRHSVLEYSVPEHIEETVRMINSLPQVFRERSFRHRDEKTLMPAGYESFSIPQQFLPSDRKNIYDRIRIASSFLCKLGSAIISGLICASTDDRAIIRSMSNRYRSPRFFVRSAHLLQGLSSWEKGVLRQAFASRRSILLTGSTAEVLPTDDRLIITPYAWRYSPECRVMEKRLAQTPEDQNIDSAIIGWDTLAMLPDSSSRRALLRQIAGLLPEGSPLLLTFMFRHRDSAFFRTLHWISSLGHSSDFEGLCREGLFNHGRGYLRFFTISQLSEELFHAGFDTGISCVGRFAHLVAYRRTSVSAG